MSIAAKCICGHAPFCNGYEGCLNTLKSITPQLTHLMSDQDPICETELFKELKWKIGQIQSEYLSMRTERMTVIEANPATHRIAKYVYGLLKAFEPKDAQGVETLKDYFEQQLRLQEDKKFRCTGKEAYADAIEVCNNIIKNNRPPAHSNVQGKH